MSPAPSLLTPDELNSLESLLPYANEQELDRIRELLTAVDPVTFADDPLGFAAYHWPAVTFYGPQRAILESVRDNPETVVPAGHELGKDFVAAAVALWFFATHHPVRVITTSVKDDHLRVLWGEIGRFLATAERPLTRDGGGAFMASHREIKKLGPDGRPCPISYLRGCVSERGEGMAGHHAAHTLLIVDEASGVEDLVYDRADTWAKRKLIIGNPYDCQNFFRRGVKGGDSYLDGRLYRRVIRIRGEDSPAVRGEPNPPPGVLTLAEYRRRRVTWDKVRQCVGLDGEFYEGAENLLFPPAWLNRAEALARQLAGRPRKAEAIGIDPGEGVANTAWAAVDKLGLIELMSMKTGDTNVITGTTIAFGRKHGAPPECWVFDAGGGGKQHADRLRAQGYPKVRTVAFGETVTPAPRRTRAGLNERVDQREERYSFKNRRAQLAFDLRELLDPAVNPAGWAIPAEYAELRRQMSPLPLLYDDEGRVRMLPKNKRSENSTEKTLVELLGCSPDEFDAACLAVHGMLHKAARPRVGAR